MASTPLAITSANHVTFAAGRSDTFTLTATRSLKPVLSAAGALPDGVEFVDNHDGTATLSGTPRTTGTYPLTITAEDPINRTAEQRLLLSVGQGWYNASWTRRKPITINKSLVAGAAPLTNFPVEILTSTDADLASKAQSSGNDILFTSSDGVTKLNHQIQSFTSATGAMWAWVQVPTLSNTTDTTLYMYYGNSSASNQQNVTGTWDSQSTAVWHLSEPVSTAAGAFKDSTINANHATYQGSPGLVVDASGGLTFDGSNDYLSTTTQQSDPEIFTIEAWFKTSTASGKPIVSFESAQTGTGAANYDRTLYIGTDGFAHFAVYDGTTAHVASGTTNLADGNWHYIAGRYNNTTTNVHLFVDGTQKGATTSPNAQAGNGYWRIGGYKATRYTGGADGTFPGSIDLVRISNSGRGSPWIQTNFNTQNNPTAYTAFGGEQTVAPPAITSASSATFPDSSPATFTVVASGGPTPTISQTGTLPSGMSFVDNGDGTGTLSGTPASGSAGSYSLSFTASNGVAPDATQNFTLIISPAWYNASWLYRKAITIDHTKVPADTTAFSVLVSLTDSSLAARALANGNDILFTDTDKVTKLNHEIESYTSASGVLVAWVQVSALSSTVDKTIYMYYGNASATNQQNVSGTWRTEYKGVWHLSQSPTATAPQFKDSTSNANNGTAQGSMTAGQQVAGKINGSITLDGSNDYVSTAVQQTNPQAFTVEGWVNTTTASGKAIVNFEDIQTGSSNTNNYDRSLYVGTDGKPRFVVYDGSAAHIATGASTITNGAWHYLVGTYDGATATLYVDNAAAVSVSSSSAQVFNGYWRFGSYHESGYTNAANGYFTGGIDEIRVSNTAWSPTTIGARYNNQSSPSTFLSLAAEEPYTVAPAITSANSASFATTQQSSFTVTTTGAPTPSITASGALPSGVTFVDNGNGTATLSGTPVSTSAGTYVLTITASNGIAPNATQTFTLSVGNGWYSNSWRYRKKITIDHTKVGATLTNFPFLVSRTDSDLAAHAQSSGNDILFTSSDGFTKLNHQIETWTSGTGVLVSWVNVPSVSSTVDTVIYMYYGNASASNQQNATAVWDSGYTGVWHLSEGPTSTAPQFKDSTSNTNHGTAQGSMLAGAQVSGKVDGSLTLDGTDDYIYTTNQAVVPNNDTIEAWFKTTSASGKRFLGYVGTQTGVTEANYDRMLWVGTDGKLRFGMYDGVLEMAVSTGTVTDGAWHHAVGVQDNTAHTLTLYLDGTAQSAVATGTTPQSYSGWWRIGNGMMYSGWTNSSAGYFPGSLDEVRVSTTARSAGWISTEYNSLSSPSTFSATASEVVYTEAPAITSANSTSFTAGSAGTFTVTTTGVPTPAITKTGSLPTGVTFVDNGNGTATLAGTPTLAGTYPLTITANNGITPNATQSFTLTVSGGSLTISLPGTANLGSALIGNTASGALGSTQVVDNRGVASASWTASVSSTTFTSGGNTVPLANVKYWSGPSTSTTGTGTFTPGQTNSGAAQDMTTSRTGFTLAGGNGINQATWNPTLMCTVPITVAPGTYSGIVTHSVV